MADFTYDALDRVLSQVFPATPAENIAYTYDSLAAGGHGIGRLAALADESGSTTFAYDARGNTTEEVRVIGPTAYATSYGHDLADNLTAIVYPSGRTVAYARDSLGRVTAVTTRADATAPVEIVADAIAYRPFGPVSGLSFGNGLDLTTTHDLDYRLTGITAGDGVTDIQDLSYGYDGTGTITAIADAVDIARDQSLVYDALYRLTQADGEYGLIDYSYDAVGNRTQRIIDDGATTTTETYAYDPFSNRLLSVDDGSSLRSIAYNVDGNFALDDRGPASDLDFLYNDAGRLAELLRGGLSEALYTYNALGQRVIKDPAVGPTLHFHFDSAGRFIAASDELGVVVEEYVYLDGLPLARIVPAGGGPVTVTDIVIGAAGIAGPDCPCGSGIAHSP